MRQASGSHTRRELLFGLAGAALAFSQPRNRIYNPQLAVHTSFWLEEAESEHRPLQDILDEAFRSMRRAGFRNVELASEFLSPGLQPRTLELLRKNKLQAALLFAEGPLYEREAAEAGRERVLQIGRLMSGYDAKWMNFSPAAKPGGQPKTTDELSTEAYQLSRMAQDLAQTGVGLTVHADRAAMENDAREWRYLLANTEVSSVSFCLDVDWAVRAGLDPLSLIDTAGPRLRNIHLRNPRKGVSQELLRDGDVDMVRIARLLREMRYDGFLTMEPLYDKATPRRYPVTEALSLSRWYMQEVFGSRPGNPPADLGPHVRERKT